MGVKPGRKRELAAVEVAALVAILALALVTAQDVPGDDESPGPVLCQGSTPAKLVVEQVLPVPAEGRQPFVLLRNVGGQTAKLAGWRLTGSDTHAAEANLVFGTPPCDNPGNTTVLPSRMMLLQPRSDSNPCGFPFSLTSRDEVKLYDEAGGLVGSVKWNTSDAASVLYLQQDGTTYRSYPETKNVVDLLVQLGGFSTFVDALRATGLDKRLVAASNTGYTGPELPKPKEEREVVPQFPWWFGHAVNRSKLPSPPPPAPPPPPPPPGIPAAGPYTVLAPSDTAFDTLLHALGGTRKLSKEQFLKLPELEEILEYHIIPGRYTTAFMFNNTPVWTSLAVLVTPFNDPCMTEGSMMLHDNCEDKPTPDSYTCEEQRAFRKCYTPFMTSALAAQWQGGFCQATCQRCSCSGGSGFQCARVQVPDVQASNGVIHGISRVLFPPPVFSKDTISTLDLVTANSAAGSLPGGLIGDLKGGASHSSKPHLSDDKLADISMSKQQQQAGSIVVQAAVPHSRSTSSSASSAVRHHSSP